MKHIYLNLKRFDIPKALGGVNSIASVQEWGGFIVENTQEILAGYQRDQVDFTMFMPEAHLIRAVEAKKANDWLQIGCQSVFREDTTPGGNFGAFTSNRTANAIKAMGCSSTIIGHCEERKDKAGIMMEAGINDADAVNRLLNKEIKAATAAGLSVLYCIGESEIEQKNWESVLSKQLEIGLQDVEWENITIAYEPVWAIGPGKTPPDQEYIRKIARFVKKMTNGLPVVYGGGLKVDNARMLANIEEIDGGLIALTRFKGDIGFYPEEFLDIIRTYLEQ